VCENSRSRFQLRISFFPSLRTYDDWSHCCGYDREYGFLSCSCGNRFLVRCCTTSLISCSFLSEQGVSWSLRTKRRIHSLAPSFSGFNVSDFFRLEICKGYCLTWKSIKYECFAWQNCQAWSVTYLPITRQKMNNVVLMCFLIIWRSTECIRNFVRSGIWLRIDFSNTLYGWRYTNIMFYFIAI